MPDAPQELTGELLSLCLPAGGAEACGGPQQSAEAHWETLISLAILQGVAPLLAVRSRPLAMPVAIRERLESLYRANALRNLRLAAEEARLCAALNSDRIRHWPLKGPGLSERLYADIGVRQIADLDVLIEPRNLSRVDALLAELGFRRQTSGRIESLGAAQELIYVREGAAGGPAAAEAGRTAPATENLLLAAEARDRARGIPPPAGQSAARPVTFLDLHQRLLPYVRRDALASRVFREGLTAENLLLYLCANQITHRFARLRYVCDIASFLERESASLDWDHFIRSARALPWGPGIGLGLRWASRFSQRPAPDKVLSSLRLNPIGDALLRRSLGADAVEAASRTHLLDTSAGAAVPFAAAYMGRPSAYGIAWNLLLPSRAYLREQGASAEQPLAAAYAARFFQKIPVALRHLIRPAP